MEQGARFRRPSGLVFLLILAGSCAPVRSETAPSVTVVRDGIMANLRVDQTGAVIDWHFVRRPPAPVDRIRVTLNGRPLGEPTAPLALFPGPGQSAGLLVLADTGADGSAILATGPFPPGVTARRVSFGVAVTPDAGPGTWPGDLPDAVSRGIDEVAATGSDRRAVVVVTDGFVRGVLPSDALEAKAKRADVILVFVLVHGSRLADVAALTRLAEATGGGAVPPGRNLAQALAQGVLSGAVLQFPYGNARRYVWERRATVAATIGYGTHTLAMSAEAALPPASLADTASLLWARARRRVPAFAGWTRCGTDRRDRAPKMAPCDDLTSAAAQRPCFPPWPRFC